MVVKASFTVTLARVDDGAQGVAGKAGNDGKTPYFHTAWSWSSDGKDRLSVAYPGENLISNQISDWELGGISNGKNTTYFSRIRLKTGVLLLPNVTYTLNSGY